MKNCKKTASFRLFFTVLLIGGSTMAATGANMIPDGSFEYNDAPAFHRMGDRDYLAGYGWAPDDSTAFDGRRSLRGEGGKKLEFSCEANELLPTEKLPWTFSIYLKANRPDTPVTLKVAVYRKLDSVGEEMSFKVGTGWTRCELTVNKRFSLGRRLGINQGPVNFTVSIPKGVTVWADAAQWEAGGQATRYAASEVDRPVPRAELVRSAGPPPLPVPAAVAAEKSGEVGLTVRNGDSKPASNVPLSTGILVPRGEFGADTRYTLLDAAGREIPCQTEPIALHLADRSILSLKLDFEADLQPGDNRFRLRYDRGPKAAATAPLSATLQTGDLLFHPARQPDQLWEGFTDRSGKLVIGPGTLAATGIDGRAYRGVNREVRTETDGPLHAVIAVNGDLVAEENPAEALLSYEARLHLWKHTPGVTVQLTVTNFHPKRTVALRDLFWKAPLPESSGENIALLQAFNPLTKKFRLGTAGKDGAFRFSDDKCATTAVCNRGEGFDYRLQIRDGWRKHPTEAAIRNREAQAFFWPGQPVQPLLFSPGMAVTRTGTLSARPGQASPAALQEDPPVVIVDSEWSLRAGIPLRLDRVGKFPALDRYLENYEEHGFFSPGSVEKQQWHGLFNYGDHSGDGGWANLESYSDYSTLLRGLRSGSPDTLRLGLAAAEHYRDMDVDHIKHFPIMHSCNHVIGGTHFGHAWIQGVLLHYLLTGDPRSREVAYQVGNAFLAIPPLDEQVREDRCLGYYLLTLSDYCLMLGDKRYIDRFYTQLRTAEKLLAAPSTPEDRLMQRTTRRRESSLFYWKISGITPFANWYGLAGLLKMYEITGDRKLLPRIRSEMAVVMDFELLYRVHLEELYPNLPPEKTLPLIASDYVGGRGSYFYPVMAAYSRVTGEENYRDLAARVAYARILEGRNGGDDADILMTALFADLPPGFDEDKMAEEIKAVYLDGAAGELLNGDFSRTRSYAEMMTPKRPDGITPEWARNVQHLSHWRFYAITEFTGTEYMRFRPELYVVADNTLTLRLRRRKWYTRAMIIDSARIRFMPGIWKFKGKVKRDENTRDVAFSFYFSDFRHTWGVLELAVEPGAKPNLQRATPALPKLLGCSVSKPDRDGFMTVEAEFEVTEPSVGFLYFLGVLRPEKAHGDISMRELEFKPKK